MKLLENSLERITNRKLVARLREAVKAHSDAWSDACEERDELQIELDRANATIRGLIGPPTFPKMVIRFPWEGG